MICKLFLVPPLGFVPTLNARPGTWIELGASPSSEARRDRGPLSADAHSASHEARIWLKLEELRP